MVAISKSRIKQRRNEKAQEKMLLSVLGILVGIYALIKLVNTQAEEGGSVGTRLKKAIHDHRPHLKLESKNSPMMSESYNAVAQDILNTLKCEELFNRTVTDYGGRGGMDDYIPSGDATGDQDTSNKLRRKLQQGGEVDDGDDSLRKDEGNNNNGEEQELDDGVPRPGEMYDDYGGGFGYEEMTAKELFCLAAATTTVSAEKIKEYQGRIQCDASDTKQTALLDLWSTARAKIGNEALLLKTLELATEATRTIGKFSLNLWAPRNDDGINYILSQVGNEEESARLNGNNFYGLSHNLGPDHLYVDVGSCLGITTMAVILQYPKTKVISIEPASPNWLLQEINLKCNLEDDQQPTVLLAGVGPNTKQTMAAKLLWRPTSVTATRSWTPREEKLDTDEELMVELRPWKTILAEAGIHTAHHIDVLHLDCEGCEYNLIPSLSDNEYESIDTVMGEMHWGYIPLHKLPSSKRGRVTHDRLCQHENFARTAKECCGNLQLQVRSAFPGEVLVQEGKDTTNGAATVEDVLADGFCDDFGEWKETHELYDIENDFGWFEMTSVAD